MTARSDRFGSGSAVAVALLMVMGFLAISGPLHAQEELKSQPESENGRYALQPITDGVIRLDTRTGQVSTCAPKTGGWACYAVPDERAALDAEIGRLFRENQVLKADLAAREQSDIAGNEVLPKQDSLKPKDEARASARNSIEIPLPAEADLQRAMSLLETVWQRLVGMADRLQKQFSEKL